MNDAESILDRPITDMKIPVAIIKALYCAGIKTVAQILEMSNEDIVSLKGKALGVMPRLELREQLSQLKTKGSAYFEDSPKIQNWENYKNIPIEILRRFGLSLRAYNILCQNGVLTLHAFIEKYNERFVSLAKVGPKTLRAYQDIVKQMDLNGTGGLLLKRENPAGEGAADSVEDAWVDQEAAESAKIMDEVADNMYIDAQPNHERYKNIAVSSLQLCVRVRNALGRNGIHNLYNLIERYQAEKLASCVCIGKGTIAEIRAFLKTLWREEEAGQDESQPQEMPRTEMNAAALAIEPGVAHSTAHGIFRRGHRSAARTRNRGTTFIASILQDDGSAEGVGMPDFNPVDWETLTLPKDVLERPICDLKVSPMAERYLGRMSITLEQTLALMVQDAAPLRKRIGEAAFREVQEQIVKLAEHPEAYFDALAFDNHLMSKLQKDYGLTQTRFAQYICLSLPWVSRKLQSRVSRGRWLGHRLLDEEKAVLLEMAAERCYFRETRGEAQVPAALDGWAAPPGDKGAPQEADPIALEAGADEPMLADSPTGSVSDESAQRPARWKKYVVLNNKLNDAAILIIEGRKVRCWFLADLPEDLRKAVVDARMDVVTEWEYQVKDSLGQVISVLRKKYFSPHKPEQFLRMARSRGMSVQEYSLFLYGLPYKGLANQYVKDDKIIQFFEQHLVDGKVYIPNVPENRWIRVYSSRHGLTLKGMMELYGYQG